VITGASRGLGKAMALALAAEGARIALGARDRERLDAVAAEMPLMIAGDETGFMNRVAMKSPAKVARSDGT